MSKPVTGPTAMDDAVQQTILALEQGKEQLGRLTRDVRSEQQTLAGQMAELERRPRPEHETIPDLERQHQEAAGRLEAALRADPPDTQAVRSAAEDLARLRADLAVARERSQSAALQRGALGQQLQCCTEVAEQAGQLLGDLETALKGLVVEFREMGSRLESAQQSRALGLHVIRAQEEERRHLAREIHDGPAQLLNSVVLRIDVCQKLFDADPQRLRDELQQLKELVRLSLQDVRKIIFDLRPMALDDLGLVPALRAFLKDYQAKTGIETDFTVFGNDRRYDSAFEVAIFRLVQEALSNVYKHAGAARVWVKVETTGGKEIKLTVKDDGAGFDPDKVRQAAAGTKFGLVGMRERAELLGGAMEVYSAPGQGTRLNFFFPLAE